MTAPVSLVVPEKGSPILLPVLAVAGIVIIGIGLFLIRRFWIRRQNPALFRDYD